MKLFLGNFDRHLAIFSGHNEGAQTRIKYQSGGGRQLKGGTIASVFGPISVHRDRPKLAFNCGWEGGIKIS